MEWLNEKTSFHSLLAAIIETALDDIKGTLPYCGMYEKDRAMNFVMGDLCESYCLELGVDCGMIRKKAAALYRK